jgi:hypothetical protein
MSILDINELVDNDELIPSIEKIKEWLNKNALKGYLDSVSYNGGRKFVSHYDDKKMNTYFTIYCIDIIQIDGQFPIFVPRALAGCMHTIDMEKFHSHKPLYIKKGVHIPYFIKKASETFYKIEII